MLLKVINSSIVFEAYITFHFMYIMLYVVANLFFEYIWQHGINQDINFKQ